MPLAISRSGQDTWLHRDRPTASIPKAQLGFLKYLCQPQFAALVKVIPRLSIAIDNLADNLAMLGELEKKKVATEQIMAAGSLLTLLPDLAWPAGSASAGSPANRLHPFEC